MIGAPEETANRPIALWTLAGLPKNSTQQALGPAA